MTVPQFVTTDPAVIENLAAQKWKEITGREYLPGQPEALFIKALVYFEVNKRLEIQKGFEQNFINYAESVNLDNIASLFGITRQSEETDERLRERIKLAPSQFATAGSVPAYIYHAKSVDASIIDVAVVTVPPCTVNVYLLTVAGLPSLALMASVLTKLTNPDIKPLCDAVAVLPPTEVEFAFSADVRLLTSANRTNLETALNTAATNYTNSLKTKLGCDIVRSQAVAALSLPGVYSVTINSPAQDRILGRGEYAKCTGIVINILDAVDG